MRYYRKIAELLLTTIAAAIIVLTINGVLYVIYGQERAQDKIEQGGDLSAYDRMTIRTLNLLNYTIGRFVCSEAAEQCWLMEHSAEDTVYLKRDFTKSAIVRAACQNSANSSIVNCAPWDLYKMDFSFVLDRIKCGGKECQYSLVYDDAEVIKSGTEAKLQTTAGIHECYYDPMFVFPFSLINAPLYDKMISQGAFRKVTVIYELP